MHHFPRAKGPNLPISGKEMLSNTGVLCKTPSIEDTNIQIEFIHQIHDEEPDSARL